MTAKPEAATVRSASQSSTRSTAGEMRSMSATLVLIAVLSAACVPFRGGWDVDALGRAQPQIISLPGNRLGDMIPFPALDGTRIVLLACRFRDERPVQADRQSIVRSTRVFFAGVPEQP